MRKTRLAGTFAGIYIGAIPELLIWACWEDVQVESAGMRKALADMHADRFEDAVELLARARELGFRRMTLETASALKDAIALYERALAAAASPAGPEPSTIIRL